MFQRKSHWEKIYGERKPDEVSWFQAEPKKSLEFISLSGASKDTPIIDVGGGASILVDRLLAQGYSDLTVLDISAAALAYDRERLGSEAAKIKWIESDIIDFKPERKYGLWHDRAVFHFLTDKADRERYGKLLHQALAIGGHLVLASFAPDGPEKCSGLAVCRYDASNISEELGPDFTLIREESESHRTPWDKEQKFRYFLLQRLS
jgi:trans-aconitate methyltransferase